MNATPYSRKQLWRRQTRSIQRDDEHDFLYQQGVHAAGTISPTRSFRDGLDVVPTRAQSLPTFGTTFLRVTGLGHVWATTGNLMAGNDSNTPSSSSAVAAAARRRRSTFAPTVRVVLIPARSEYEDQGLAGALWWEDSDYTQVRPV